MIEPDHRNLDALSLTDRVLAQIAHCLRQGCVICIEHTPKVTPHWSPWMLWGEPCCYNGNTRQIYREIDRCRAAHADHHIRLNIEDHSCHSRFSFVVHSPPAPAGS
jgi:ribulose-bisphosphate carboxylase small chain